MEGELAEMMTLVYDFMDYLLFQGLVEYHMEISGQLLFSNF